MGDARQEPRGGAGGAVPADDDATRTGGASGTSANPGGTVSDPALARLLAGGPPPPFRERFPFADRLGRGGMGEVYAAHDRVLDRHVAVKVLRADARDDSALRRFLREARVTAKLEHPNVPPAYTLELTADARPAFVMKRVQGETLKEYVEAARRSASSGRERSPEHRLAARLERFLKVCDAIAFAHDLGVVHRDLKPSNVMIGRFGQVYVMDWGIARLVGREDDDDAQLLPDLQVVDDGTGLLTGTDGFLGTPRYMAPEQAIANAETGPASDQFALGMILQELVTLRPARDAETGTSMLFLALEGRRSPMRPASGEGAVPRGLRAIVGRTTELEPTRRYPSVSALAADVRRFLHDEALEVRPDPPLARVWRFVKKHPAVVLGALLAVVALSAASTTASLLAAVHARDDAARRTSILTALVGRLGEHVSEFDRRADGVRVLTEALGVAAEEALAAGSAGAAAFPRPADLAADPARWELVQSPWYGIPITWRTSVAVVAPGADPAAVAAVEARLGRVAARQRELFLRAIQGVPATEALGLPPEEQDALLRRPSPLRYVSLGLEEGLLLDYPGLVNYPPGYDPRARSWYAEGAAQPSPGFGAPYPDAAGTGYLIGCHRRVLGPDGELAGVVGVTASLELVLAMLDDLDLEHPHAALLCDGQGRVVARPEDTERGRAVSLNENRPKELEDLDVPGLDAVLRSGPFDGVYEEGVRVHLFRRVDSVDWYLVVTIEAEEVFR